MKRWLWLGFSVVAMARAQADVMTLTDGNTISGKFAGFSSRKFDFNPASGGQISEYPLNVSSIILDAPAVVSVKFSRKRYDNIDLVGFGHNTLRLRKNGAIMEESVLMLKELTVAGDAGAQPTMPTVIEPPVDADVAKTPPRTGIAEPDIVAPRPVKEREWTRSGKWREMEDDSASQIISHGEVVDVEASIRKGYVNIVHFHMPRTVSSIREGNYIQALSKKRSNRLVVWKVVVPDFHAPVCSGLGLKSLPQVWVYDAQGRLVKKLTDRFTEGDIDAAIKSARLGTFP